jgi:hypothetical protein
VLYIFKIVALSDKMVHYTLCGWQATAYGAIAEDCLKIVLSHEVNHAVWWQATAYDAIAEDVPKIVVLSDATASATPEVQEANLFDLRQVGVLTPGLDEWVASLSAFAGVLPTLSTFGWGAKS